MDTDSLRQMIKEALQTYPPRYLQNNPTATERDRLRVCGGFDLAVRFIAYAIGGTYHGGYDREANNAWRAIHASVKEALVGAYSYMDPYITDSLVDRVLQELTRISQPSQPS